MEVIIAIGNTIKIECHNRYTKLIIKKPAIPHAKGPPKVGQLSLLPVNIDFSIFITIYKIKIEYAKITISAVGLLNKFFIFFIKYHI